ncbi:hypothetical protein BKA69DRAFT_555150 [Paraphysoderma sedebokerense]|nr:hypothetical protein BKA69DRAFT_555150 [Paraphysoderma sedebokerense]
MYKSSDTDFSVYFEAGLPGIDFAYYESRDVYHSPHDNIENISPPNIQQLGANILAFVKAMSNSGLLKNLKADGESDFFHGRQTLWSGVFYDIVGLWNFHLSSKAFTAFQSLIFVALLFITTCAESGFASRNVRSNLKSAVFGFSRLSSILLLSFLMSSLLNYLVTCLNPAVISGRPFILPMFSFCTSLFCAELVITFIVRYRWWGGEYVDHYESLLSGVSLLWIFVMVFGIYTLSVHIALVSVYVWFGLCWLIVYGIFKCSLILTARLKSDVTDSIRTSGDDNASSSNGPESPQESDASLSDDPSSDEYAAQMDPLLESEIESEASDVEEQPYVIAPIDDADFRSVYRGFLIAISASLFPSIFYLDISESLMHAVNFMVQEGVSPLIYAVLYPIWYSALIVNFIPVLFIMTHNATQDCSRIFILMCGAISLGILITACLIFPFADHTYLKVLFSQQYFFNHTFTPSLTEMTVPIIPSRHPFTTIAIPSSLLPLSQIFPFPSFNSSALNCSGGQIVNLCTTAGLQFFPAIKSPDHQPFPSDFASFTVSRQNSQTIVVLKIKNNRYLSSSYSVSASDPDLQVNITSSHDGHPVQSSWTLNQAVRTFMFSDNFRDYHSVAYTIHKSRGSGGATVDFELIIPIDDVVLWRDVVDRGYSYFKEHLPNFVTITGLGHPRNGLANVNMKIRVEL